MIYSGYPNDMDIVSFRTFIAAADTRSFAAAAQRVHASPSSVTERIKQLEHQLGARLFERDKRGCRLTTAGQKFLAPAQQAIRAWDIAQHNVSLPEQFSTSVAFGGQYALWRPILTSWLANAREIFPDIAFRVTAGASARLNRDLDEGFLDVIVVYDPVFRKNMRAEKLFDDRLVLVTGGDIGDWRDNYVRVEWGQALSAELASTIDITPSAGLVLDIGNQAARWLIDQKMAGFMPERLVHGHIAEGRLYEVPDVPRFDYPAYICWRENVDNAHLENLVRSLREYQDLSSRG